VNGTPSSTLYRGSLAALLVAALLGVWLVVRPPESSGEGGLTPTQVAPLAAAQTATAAAQPSAVQNTPAAGQTPAPGSPAPAATATTAPRVTGTVTPLVTGTPSGASTPAAGSADYTVRSGDSLTSICTQVKPASMSVTDCVEQVQRANGLSSADSLSIGQVLRVPR
jgi:Tfp pilus assembly protein FimV